MGAILLKLQSINRSNFTTSLIIYLGTQFPLFASEGTFPLPTEFSGDFSPSFYGHALVFKMLQVGWF